MGAHSFDWKEKISVSSEELERVLQLPIQKTEEFENLDDPKYHWVMVGRDKYGRTMYCLNTGVRRGLTMGEFYQGGVVD